MVLDRPQPAKAAIRRNQTSPLMDPQERQRVRRPKQTWRRREDAEAKTVGRTGAALKKTRLYRVSWSSFCRDPVCPGE
ncbi:hypothetical protein PoB_000306000 [Plakobranchus ocellatus]|uniref:Uncharacterized protein n=1 Tax=Plakobranchus ocellatus TaxID=259542 RepID=A0AAV3Y1J0_9GAST|nr:hypothetical protein PoB_000306000 [Plakobranchus ocellatus]